MKTRANQIASTNTGRHLPCKLTCSSTTQLFFVILNAYRSGFYQSIIVLFTEVFSHIAFMNPTHPMSIVGNLYSSPIPGPNITKCLIYRGFCASATISGLSVRSDLSEILTVL
jgi:hypothetical protein